MKWEKNTLLLFFLQYVILYNTMKLHAVHSISLQLSFRAILYYNIIFTIYETTVIPLNRSHSRSPKIRPLFKGIQFGVECSRYQTGFLNREYQLFSGVKSGFTVHARINAHTHACTQQNTQVLLPNARVPSAKSCRGNRQRNATVTRSFTTCSSATRVRNTYGLIPVFSLLVLFDVRLFGHECYDRGCTLKFFKTVHYTLKNGNKG